MLTTPDWILAATLCVFLPAFGAWSYPRFRRRVAAGEAQARIQEYSNTLRLEWGLVLATGLLWLAQERSVQSLGLGLPLGTGFVIAVGIAVVLISLQLLQIRAILRDPEKQQEMHNQLGKLAALLPHTRRERVWFSALSITAGICEEILFRGFLLWMATALVGLPMAVVLTSVLFGVAHLYQGPVGGVKAAAVGLVMALLTVLSGSIWLPMVLHAVLDLSSGAITAGSAKKAATPDPVAE